MPHRIAAVIFDLDGTLLDTLHDIANSANEVLAGLGYAPHPIERYRQFIGAGVAVLFERALPVPQRDAQTVEACVAGFREVYGRRWKECTRPYDGVSALLGGLRARQLPCSVLSNKPHDFTRDCVAKYFSEVKFAAVFGARVGIPHKPDPTAAQEIVQIMKVPPANCLYLGDSAVDMQTAVAAGLLPIGALWGFRSRDELEEAGAAIVVERPEQVLDILDADLRM